MLLPGRDETCFGRRSSALNSWPTIAAIFPIARTALQRVASVANAAQIPAYFGQDLGDKAREVAIQVTSRSDAAKIHDTVKKIWCEACCGWPCWTGRCRTSVPCTDARKPYRLNSANSPASSAGLKPWLWPAWHMSVRG